MELADAIDLAAYDYRTAAGGPDCTPRDFVDAVHHGGMVTRDQVADWLSDGAIDCAVADAYLLVLDATLDQLDAALAQRATGPAHATFTGPAT